THHTMRRSLREAGSGPVVNVCDVNLRQHFYDAPVIEQSLRRSHWLKLNDQELPVLRGLLGLKASDPSALRAEMRAGYGLALVCLTRGEHGCVVQTADEEVDQPGVKVPVADTVGAGDAFTAGLLCQTLEGRPLAEAVRFANRLAAEVARRP